MSAMEKKRVRSSKSPKKLQCSIPLSFLKPGLVTRITRSTRKEVVQNPARSEMPVRPISLPKPNPSTSTAPWPPTRTIKTKAELKLYPGEDGGSVVPQRPPSDQEDRHSGPVKITFRLSKLEEGDKKKKKGKQKHSKYPRYELSTPSTSTDSDVT